LKTGLLDDRAFGQVLVAAATSEADDAFFVSGYVEVRERVAMGFSLVNAPQKINLSWAHRLIVFGPPKEPCAVSAEGKPQR